LSFEMTSADTSANQSPVNSRTKREIDTWRPYVEALRIDDRQILRDLINSVSSSYGEAMNKAERGYDTESLLISLILDQQKTINWLSSRVRKLQQELTSKQD